MTKTKRFYLMGTTIVLHDDVWSRIVPCVDSKILPALALRQILPYIDSETLPALAYAGKMTRDAAVFRNVANGSFSLLPKTEHNFVEFAK